MGFQWRQEGLALENSMHSSSVVIMAECMMWMLTGVVLEVWELSADDFNLLSEVISQEQGLECQAPVAHVYNPGYSGGRDQEDLCLKPAQILKISNTKKGWWSCLSARA
jgi:hypothetical protein